MSSYPFPMNPPLEAIPTTDLLHELQRRQVISTFTSAQAVSGRDLQHSQEEADQIFERVFEKCAVNLGVYLKEEGNIHYDTEHGSVDPGSVEVRGWIKVINPRSKWKYRW